MPYSEAIRDQSVSAAGLRQAGHAAIAACREHGPALTDPPEDVDALVDLVVVPLRAILVLEGDQLSVDDRPGGASPAAASAPEAGRLGLVRHQRDEQPSEPDRLPGRGSTGHRPVALVEEQVDHGQHAGRPGRQQVGRRDTVRDGGSADLALARTSRWAMVEVGIWKARAISSVVSPATVRKVTRPAPRAAAPGGSR